MSSRLTEGAIKQGHPGIIFQLSRDKEFSASHGGKEEAPKAEQVQAEGRQAGEQY